MSDEELKRLKTLCSNWRESAKRYRGKGFANNAADIKAARFSVAAGMEQCAKELARNIRKPRNE